MLRVLRSRASRFTRDAAVVRACERALVAAGPVLDGWCHEVVSAARDELAGRDVRLVCRDVGALHGVDERHWTLLVDGVEYDPTIGYAQWSRGVAVPRGALHVVRPGSPHDNWPVIFEWRVAA